METKTKEVTDQAIKNADEIYHLVAKPPGSLVAICGEITRGLKPKPGAHGCPMCYQILESLSS